MIPLFGVFVPLLVAYAVTLQWCVERWNAPTQYFAHCWLVPIVAAIVTVRRRADWSARARAVDRRGWWLLGPGLALHLLGAALMIDSWSAASLLLSVPGALWLAFGRERLRGQWPVVWLVLFAIPSPIYVEGRAAFVLKEIAVRGGAAFANALGAGVVRHGDELRPLGLDGSLYVADACSGLRSLLAMLTLAYCIAFFSGPQRTVRRVVLLLAAAPLAICANLLRISALCLMARWFGVPFAEGTGHDVANVVEWLSLVALLLAVDAVLRRRAGAARTVAAPAPAAASPGGSLRGIGVVLWLLAGPLLGLSAWRPFGAESPRAERLPRVVAGYTQLERSAADEAEFQARLPRWRELLGTGDFVWRSYRDAQGFEVALVALFHDANWKSVHPPRICIEGSDMDIVVDDLVPAPWHEALPLSRIVSRRRSDGWQFVTVSLFGTASWQSGDYWQFTLHHLPRAVLRDNESGFLLRVESPVYKGEHPSLAEARAERFLEALLTPARELLR